MVEAAKEFGRIVGEQDMDRARARDAELAAELASGRMETRRQKFVPDLETGILDFEPGVPRAEQVAGTLMPQPEVYAPDGSKRLLDDLVPMEWLYVTAGFEEQGWMDGLENVWRSIGGRRIVILPDDGVGLLPSLSPGPSGAWSGTPSGESSGTPSRLPKDIKVFNETDHRFAHWCNYAGLAAVFIRPDRYVYAGASSPENFATKVTELRLKLTGKIQEDEPAVLSCFLRALLMQAIYSRF